jgi:hypothetical protein
VTGLWCTWDLIVCQCVSKVPATAIRNMSSQSPGYEAQIPNCVFVTNDLSPLQFISCLYGCETW